MEKHGVDCVECGRPAVAGTGGLTEEFEWHSQGPFCRRCYDDLMAQEREANGQFGVGA